MNWVLQHESRADPRTASFPEQASAPSGFIRLAAGGEAAVLKGTTRRGAAGNEVWVPSGTLPNVSDRTEVSVTSTSRAAFQRYWVIRDPARRRALLGLIVALTGLVLKLALELGKTYPIIVVGEAGITISNVVGTVLAFLGLLVTFWGVYASTD
jgi:hypothetical protein